MPLNKETESIHLCVIWDFRPIFFFFFNWRKRKENLSGLISYLETIEWRSLYFYIFIYYCKKA